MCGLVAKACAVPFDGDKSSSEAVALKLTVDVLDINSLVVNPPDVLVIVLVVVDVAVAEVGEVDVAAVVTFVI